MQDIVFSEKDLHQFMQDQASRAVIQGSWQLKQAYLQRINCRIQTLTDAEFEVVYKTIDALLDNYQNEKVKKNPTSKNADKNSNLTETITNQNLKK